MGVNSVTLVGRAGRDPEVRYFESGSMVANLTMAVNRRSGNDDHCRGSRTGTHCSICVFTRLCTLLSSVSLRCLSSLFRSICSSCSQRLPS